MLESMAAHVLFADMERADVAADDNLETEEEVEQLSPEAALKRLLEPVAANDTWMVHLDLQHYDMDEDDLLSSVEPTLRRKFVRLSGFGCVDLSADTAKNMVLVAEALRGNTHVRTLDLSWNELESAGVSLLLPALRESAVELVDFCGCEKISDDMKSQVISVCLPKTCRRLAADDPELTAVKLQQSKMGPFTVEHITDVIDALLGNSHLLSLHITSNCLTYGHLQQLAQVLGESPASSIRRIILKGRQISNTGSWGSLLPMLAALHVPEIESLEGPVKSADALYWQLERLRANEPLYTPQDQWQTVSVGDDDIEQLAAALKCNTQIKGIDLDERPDLTEV